MTINMLKLNDSKTELLLLTTNMQCRSLFNDFSLSIGEADVKSDSSARNLGVIFDSCLDMEQHIKMTTQKAFYHIRKLGKIRKYLDKQTAETVVHAFITSRLDYCNGLLYGIPQNLLRKLQYIHNTAARIVTNTPRRAHITPILKALHWLPVKQRIKFKILLLTFKAMNNLAPSYMKDMIKWYTPAKNLRSGNQKWLAEPTTRLKTVGDRAFSKASPPLWNPMPMNVKLARTVDSFKSRTKHRLFLEAFGDMT